MSGPNGKPAVEEQHPQRRFFSSDIVERGLQEFTMANVEQGRAPLPPFDCALTDWAMMLVGDARGVADLIGKQRQGEPVTNEEIGVECANVLHYLCILSHRLGIDLGHVAVEKFNAVSVERGAPEFFLRDEVALEGLSNRALNADGSSRSQT